MIRIANSAVELSRVLLPVAILAVGVGGIWLFGQKPPPTPRPPADDTGALVRTAAAQAFTDDIVFSVEGVAVPHRQITLAAQVAGQIVLMDPRSRQGKVVREGDFLIQIDPADYVLEVSRIESNLQHTDEQIRAAEVDIANTAALTALAEEEVRLRQKDLQRQRTLFRQSAASERELDESLRMELAARNALQTLNNQRSSLQQQRATLVAARKQVEVQLERARLDESRARVVSPLSGTVTTNHVEAGDFVNRGDPLLLLSDPWPMEIKCSLRVDQLYWLWQRPDDCDQAADPAAVFEFPTTDVFVQFAFRGVRYEWQGVLSRYEGSGLDPDTRLIPCRVRVDNPTQVRADSTSSDFTLPSLFSGMYVTVRIPVATPLKLVSIPATGLRPGGRVWLMRDGKLEIIEADLAMSERDRAILRQTDGDGIRPGDEVVTSPLPSVSRGMKLRESDAR